MNSIICIHLELAWVKIFFPSVIFLSVSSTLSLCREDEAVTHVQKNIYSQISHSCRGAITKFYTERMRRLKCTTINLKWESEIFRWKIFHFSQFHLIAVEMLQAEERWNCDFARAQHNVQQANSRCRNAWLINLNFLKMLFCCVSAYLVVSACRNATPIQLLSQFIPSPSQFVCFSTTTATHRERASEWVCRWADENEDISCALTLENAETTNSNIEKSYFHFTRIRRCVRGAERICVLCVSAINQRNDDFFSFTVSNLAN